MATERYDLLVEQPNHTIDTDILRLTTLFICVLHIEVLSCHYLKYYLHFLLA